MRRLPLVALLAALLLGTLAAPPAGAAPAGPLAERCAAVDARLVAACYAGDIAVRDAEALCRRAGAGCQPAASPAAVGAYERTWMHRALGEQRALGDDVPLRDAPWIGTHNSFNSVAEMGPALSALDSNQQLTLVDQLRLDVRSLELDVHWFPSVSAGGQRAPVVCHAEGNHAGCTVEQPLQPVLERIAAWSRSHPDDVLLLYLEDHLDGQEGSAAAAAAVRAALGPLLHVPAAPAGARCTPLPLGLSRRQLRARGGRIVLVSGCDSEGPLRALAYGWDDEHVESRPRGYREYPRCGRDFDRETYNSKLVRYFEDSTGLTTGASLIGQAELDDGITPATAGAMTRCGVDLLGLDQLLPRDGRLEALVWSWAKWEPRADAGGCAVQRASDGRWIARGCADAKRRPACREPGGRWVVPARAVARWDAAEACASSGARFAVPRTGHENQRLRRAAGGADGTAVWLAYARSGPGWAVRAR